MIVLPLIAVFSLVGLLISVKNEDQRLKWIFKPLTSLLFVLTGLWLADFSTLYDVLIVVGLMLGMAGDVLLIPDGKKWFIMGLIAFLLGHIVYLVAFLTMLVTPRLYALSLLPILIGQMVFYFIKPHLGSMRRPVTIYYWIITFMMCTAMAVFFEPEAAQRFRWLVFLGAACFYASDLAVALDRFVNPSFKQAYWGLPLYYIGQFLLAFSIDAIVS